MSYEPVTVKQFRAEQLRDRTIEENITNDITPDRPLLRDQWFGTVLGRVGINVTPPVNVNNVITIPYASTIELNLAEADYFKIINITGNTTFTFVGAVQQGSAFTLELNFGAWTPTYDADVEQVPANANNKPVMSFPFNTKNVPDIDVSPGNQEDLMFSTLDQGATWNIMGGIGIFDGIDLTAIETRLGEIGEWFDVESARLSAWFIGTGDKILTALGSNWMQLETWYDGINDQVTEWFVDTGDKIKLALGESWDDLNNWFMGINEGATEFFDNIEAGIKKGWTALDTWFTKVSSDAEEFFGNIEAGIKKGWAELDNWFTAQSAAVTKWFGNIGAGISKAFEDASEGFLKWTEDMWKGLDPAVDSALTYVAGVGKDFVDFLFQGLTPDAHAESIIDTELGEGGSIEMKIEADLRAVLDGINMALSNGAAAVTGGLDFIVAAFGNLFSSGSTDTPDTGGGTPAPTTNLSSLTTAITWAGNAGGGGSNSIGFSNSDFYIKFNNFNDAAPDQLIMQFNQDDVYVDPHGIRFENDDAGDFKRDPSRGEIRYVDGTFKAKLKNDTIVDFADIGTGGTTAPTTPTGNTFATLSVTGDTMLGNSANVVTGDTLTINSQINLNAATRFNGNIIPLADAIIQDETSLGTGNDLGSTLARWRAIYTNHVDIAGNLGVANALLHTGTQLSFYNKGTFATQHHVNNVNNNAGTSVVRDSLQRVIQALQDYGLIRGNEPE